MPSQTTTAARRRPLRDRAELQEIQVTDAIANAYRGPNESPKDSRTSLAGIRQANQGVFVILPRDQASGISEESQPAKVVRVVTTVEYFLR